MHLIPDRAVIYTAIHGGLTVHEDMREVVALFAPIIQANKEFLVSDEAKSWRPEARKSD